MCKSKVGEGSGAIVMARRSQLVAGPWSSVTASEYGIPRNHVALPRPLGRSAGCCILCNGITPVYPFE